MIKQTEIDITIRVLLEVNTEKIEYSVHGGLQPGIEDDEIIKEAENAVYCSLDSGTATNVQWAPGVLILSMKRVSYSNAL